MLLRAARNVRYHVLPANEWHGCWHCTASTTPSTSNASSAAASSTASLIWSLIWLLELRWSPCWWWGIRRRRGRMWSPCWWGIRRRRGRRANPNSSVAAPDCSLLGGKRYHRHLVHHLLLLLMQLSLVCRHLLEGCINLRPARFEGRCRLERQICHARTDHSRDRLSSIVVRYFLVGCGKPCKAIAPS